MFILNSLKSSMEAILVGKQFHNLIADGKKEKRFAWGDMRSIAAALIATV